MAVWLAEARSSSSGILPFEALDLTTARSDGCAKLAGHLLRLPADVRYQRFCVSADDSFVADYVHARLRQGAKAYAWLEDGIVRGVAELHPINEECAEAALSVEPAWQGLGIGTQLMAHLIENAARLNILEVLLCCDSRNYRMLRIAKRYGGTMVLDGDCLLTVRVSHALFRHYC